MKDLAYLIISELFTKGELDLPGIGLLSVEKIPSKRMVHEQTIYGPKYNIIFKELSGTSDNLTEHSNNRANRKKNKIATRILNDLLNFGESQILHFGTFQVDQNGSYTFSLDTTFKKSLEDAYPDLPLVIPKSKKKQPEQIAKSFDYLLGPTHEKKTKIGWFFPLLALFATSVLLACMISCFIQQKLDRSFVPIIEKISRDSSITDSVAGEKKAMFDPEDSIHKVNELEGMPGKYESDTEQEDIWEYDTDEDNFDNQYYPEFAPEENFKQIQAMDLNNVLQQSADKRLSFQEPCMVVVGSYQRRDLLDQMVSNLNELGYNIYIEKYGSFYRTAIIYECSEKNQQQFLSKIRSEIEPKAWILQY